MIDATSSIGAKIFLFLVLAGSAVLFILAFIHLVKTYINYIDRLRTGATKSAFKAKVVESDILNELKNLPGTFYDHQKTVEALTKLFNNELEKKTEAMAKELDHKYDVMLKEKDKQFKDVNIKYKTTLVEKKQTETVIRSIAEGLLVLDKNGKVIMMNPAAEKLLDVQKEKQIGSPLLDNLKNEQLVSMVKQNSESEQKEIELNAKNEDTKKTLRSSTAVIEDENGKTIGMVSVLTDVTKQKELDRLKDEFVSSVSHELRTPLESIKNAITIMLNETAGQLTEDQKKFLTMAERNLKRLRALIDDLLDLSKLEAKKMTLKKESYSILKVISDAFETMSPWAKAKEIILSKQCENNLPDIFIDPNRITQVLINLIGNAIKFTPKNGSIKIEAKKSQDKQFIMVFVEDTGIGIAKEDIDKIFLKFVQVGERNTSDMIGTGLGLSITKELIELHNGKIWAESELNKGTKFIFSLPIYEH